MDQQVHTSEPYDYRQYDRVWQRVAPTLEPYPGMQTGEMLSGNTMTAIARQESTLPGAVQNPCCMGSAAAESLEVLVGFIEEELAEQRYYLAFSRQAPAWARQRLRELGAGPGSRARRLMAIYYLITGECYRPAVSCDRVCVSRCFFMLFTVRRKKCYFRQQKNRLCIWNTNGWLNSIRQTE